MGGGGGGGGGEGSYKPMQNRLGRRPLLLAALLGGSRGMLPQRILRFQMLSEAFWRLKFESVIPV